MEAADVPATPEKVDGGGKMAGLFGLGGSKSQKKVDKVAAKKLATEMINQKWYTHHNSGVIIQS